MGKNKEQWSCKMLQNSFIKNLTLKSKNSILVDCSVFHHINGKCKLLLHIWVTYVLQ